MSAKLKLYYDFLSHPSRALYIILKLSKTPFEAIHVSLQTADNTSEEFKQINRFQRLPCIVEGDFKLAESVAILRYLQSTGRVLKTLYPTDAQGCGRVDEFLDWQHLAIRREGFVFFRFQFMEPLFTGQPTPEGKVKVFRERFEKQLDILENTWLKASTFVAGDSLTVADIFGTSELQQSKMAGYDISVKYPKITKWMERVRAETNPVFDEAHDVVYELSEYPRDLKSLM